MLTLRVPIFHTGRRICRRLAIVALMAAPAAPVMLAQPIQERLVSRHVEVPAISERIDVRPIDDQIGSFAGLKTTATTRIYGVVINEAGTVLPSAGTIIIRNLRDGREVAQSAVDALGQFNIRGIGSGLYMAELVNSSGTILTSSPAFTVGGGEVIQLTPVVPQHSFNGLAHFLNSGTTAAVNSAIAAGVLTVAPLPSVSPE
jgi:hypothetical protein